MTQSSSLVLYRPGPTSSLTSPPRSTSLISSRLFSHQTGTAIATELLYRILYDIINRFLATFHRLASQGVEEASSWLGRKMQERRERLQLAKDGSGGLGIMEEVDKAAEKRGWSTTTCPMGGDARGRPQPPWMRSVLQGIEEGRMQGSDFFTNQW